MSSLKTGTKLHGTVVYSTPFAAFISAGTVCVGCEAAASFYLVIPIVYRYCEIWKRGRRSAGAWYAAQV
jgi:hypothetical protein